jgi:hypothetical protein
MTTTAEPLLLDFLVLMTSSTSSNFWKSSFSFYCSITTRTPIPWNLQNFARLFSPHFVSFHSFYLHVPEPINKLWSLQIQLLNKKCMTLSISMDSNNWSIIHLTLIALIAAIVGSPQSVTHNSVSYKHYKFVTLFAGHWVVCCRPNHGFTICPKQKQQLQSQHFLVSCRRKSQNNIFQNTLPSFKT